MVFGPHVTTVFIYVACKCSCTVPPISMVTAVLE